MFQAQFGFYDSVVAAPSQAAALRAWGTHQNLFAEGQARVATDAAAVAAALSRPEVPLRRPLGSTGAFEVDPTELPAVPDLPKHAARTAHAKAEPKPRPKPPPDRSALDAAERAVVELDERRKKEEDGFRIRQNELDAEVIAAQKSYRDRHNAVRQAVEAARHAYRKAGGRD